LERVCDGHDLHHVVLEQPLHANPHGGVGEPHALGDGCVGRATVGLQLLDDRLGDVVKAVVQWFAVDRTAPGGGGSSWAHSQMVSGLLSLCNPYTTEIVV